MAAFRDLIGQRFSRLLVVSYGGRKQLTVGGQKRTTWECVCDCGNAICVYSQNLLKGTTTSCGCYRKEVMSRMVEDRTIHGMSKTKEYVAWIHAKARVLNPEGNNESYVGLSFDEDWIQDFQAFYDHIAPAPDNSFLWSVGRIDNNIGYISGNVRWETHYQQSKCKGRYKSNKSGINGVRYERADDRWLAEWQDIDSKSRKKSFSCKKLGEAEAFRLACECRLKAIQDLNAQGAGYSETHGLPRPEAQEV